MNSKRGGVTLSTDDGEYVVRITTNAMVRYQDLTGESFLEGIAALQDDQGDIRRMRNLFWAGISHVDGMTPDKAGDIMDEAGFSEALGAVSEAAVLAFPAGEDGEAGNAKPRSKATKKTT